MSDYKSQGLFSRYHYERADGKALDPEEQLFSLRYDKDDAWGAICRLTLKDFCDRADAAGYKLLADDLRSRIKTAEDRILEQRAAPLPGIPVL